MLCFRVKKELINSQSHKLTNSQSHKLTNSQAHKLINSQTHKLINSQAHKLIKHITPLSPRRGVGGEASQSISLPSPLGEGLGLRPRGVGTEAERGWE